MDFAISDFNGADRFFAGRGRRYWDDLSEVFDRLTLQVQPSQQAGRLGAPIFDPKATNAALTREALDLGWDKVPVPNGLRSFGADWDAGRGNVLVEWQFSNYPFLWNNITRTEIVARGGYPLAPPMSEVQALVIVTKSGSIPASNSTLYYEQAHAQLATVTDLAIFELPIRLVGLGLPHDITTTVIDWNTYANRYGRVISETDRRVVAVSWGRPGLHGNRSANFSN